MRALFLLRLAIAAALIGVPGFDTWPAVASEPTSPAAKRGSQKWVLLHSEPVIRRAANQTLLLTGDKGRARAIRLVARGGALELSRIVIRYGNGQAHFEDRAIKLLDGKPMKAMAEREEPLIIESVSLAYKSGPSRITVEVWGLQGAEPSTAQRTPELRAGKYERVAELCKPETIKAAGNAKFRPFTKARELDGKGAAMADAVKDWQREVRARYGEQWSEYTKAMGTEGGPPELSCAPARAGTIGGSFIRCTISARPCPMAPESAAPELKKYSELQVFFGTTRQQEADSVKDGLTRANFGGSAGSGLIVGRTVVTIPIEREKGSIPRPDVSLLVARVQVRNEDRKRDFTIAAVDVLRRNEFVDGLDKQIGQTKAFPNQAFVFVHGYSVGFDDAVFRTAQIAHDMGFDGPAISFSWPSRGGMLDYRHDVDAAKASRVGLRELLELIARETSTQSINLVAHSMGGDPVLEVLSKQGDIARAGGAVTDIKLKEIILAAPDISRQVFEQLAPTLKGLAKGGVTLYASANDRALLASKKVARGLVRAGDVPSQGPVIVPGIETIDVTDASSSFFSSNHSTFADRQHIVIDMGLLFERGVRPPNERFKIFEVRGREPNQYWRYLKN